jgi:hypothetical protein
MGRKSQCNRRTNYVKCRNLSACQREYITGTAAVATVGRGYVVSESAIIAEIIGEKMRKENFSCEILKD